MSQEVGAWNIQELASSWMPTPDKKNSRNLNLKHNPHSHALELNVPSTTQKPNEIPRHVLTVGPIKLHLTTSHTEVKPYYVTQENRFINPEQAKIAKNQC